MAEDIDFGGEKGVRSLQRGLEMLRAMNAEPTATVTRWAAMVGVPRSTAYRLLDTLVAMGFVTPSTSTERYALTREVYTLSRGFIDEEWIEEAWSEMLELTGRILWPIDILTADGATMVVRRSTHQRSTLSIDYGMIGRRWRMAESAAGHAYLAFCPDRERETLMELIRAEGEGPKSRLDQELFDTALERTRETGLGARFRGMMPKTGSISAPVMMGQEVICCVSIIWIASALSTGRAIEELGPALKETAARILAIVEASRPNRNTLQMGRA